MMIKKGLEHSIRWWLKWDGSWDITHHKQRNRTSQLSDVDKDFKNFKKYKDMIVYAKKLKERVKKGGGNIIRFGFDFAGFQCKNGCWTGWPQNTIQEQLYIQAKKSV